MPDPKTTQTPVLSPTGLGIGDYWPPERPYVHPPSHGSGQVDPFEEWAAMSEWPAIRKAARWFDLGRQVTLAGSVSRSEIIAVQTDAGEFAILRYFANGVGSASDAPFVTFAMLMDGAPIAGFESIIGPKSPALSVPDPIVIGLYPRQRLSVVASNTSASAVTNVGARLKGFYWIPMIRGR